MGFHPEHSFQVLGTPYTIGFDGAAWYVYRRANRDYVGRDYVVAGLFSSRALAEREVERRGYSRKAVA